MPCYGVANVLATLIYARNTYWIRYFIRRGLLRQPRRLAQRIQSRQLFTDATPTSAAAVFLGPPRLALVQHYTDHRAIVWAEMAAALRGVIWATKSILQQPTSLTLHTDSTIVRGTGFTLRSSPLLQEMYIHMYVNLNKAGHSLVCRWVPSEGNLADPLTRGVPAI